MGDRKTIRSGIVGAGFAAAIHMKAIRRLGGINADCVGVYAKDWAEDFAEEWDLNVYDSLESLLDDVDLVHVCTPPVVHEDIAVEALKRDKCAVVEKPLTGYFGDGSPDFNGDTFDKTEALDHSLASIRRMLDAEEDSEGQILYAENWVYAPAVQKEREIVEKTGAQLLWMHGEESHSGSHAETYAYWKYSGGGVMIGKGVHPLGAALYLKQVEGLTRDGQPIRPASVSAHTHAITRLPNFRDEGHLRCDYHDIEDFSGMHVVFEDGTAADIFAHDIVMGGIHNWIEVCGNNHRTICNINPNNAMETYNPAEDNFSDIYVVEKIGTKQGWSQPCPDEHWFTGYTQEAEDFYRCAATGESPQSDSKLAADCISTIYSAYVSAQQDSKLVDVTTL